MCHRLLLRRPAVLCPDISVRELDHHDQRQRAEAQTKRAEERRKRADDARAKCELAGENPQIATAAKAETAIEKGFAGPGLLAYIVTSKFADYLPLCPVGR